MAILRYKYNGEWYDLVVSGTGLDEPAANLLYVRLDGGVMTGPLTLSANPVNPLHAAPRQYVDSRIWTGTQAEYNAITTKDPDVLYVVTG